jgi:UDP-N-acetylmuramoyl-L-alanyl-D-glutamate--2,6-diaminopimelate ligase
VRSGGDCLIVEEDSEIRELLSGIQPRSNLAWPASPRLWVRAQALHWRGSRVQAISLDGVTRTAHLPLVGDSNLKALDRALSLVIHAGCCPSRSLATLPLLDPPTGLLEPVHAGQPYGVFVDRAASAADLAELLAEARTLSGRRILLVTGIRGNSSPEERRAMGAASAAADEVVFTSDNPRHSPLQTLLNDLREGLGGGGIVEPDRRAAITRAIRGAKSDDLVIIAGKGGRPVQEVGSAVMPWDDRLHARDALAGRGWVGDAL